MKQKNVQNSNKNKKVEAIIKHDHRAKFIALKVGTGKNQKDVLVSLPLEYHADIYKAFRKTINKSTQVCGGGRLEIDRNRCRIKVYGHSGSYGLYDKVMVEGILKTTHPKFKIEVRKSTENEY